MFDIGFWELLAVLTLGLLVLGPERLAQVVRTAGRWLGRARTMARNMQYEIEREVSIAEFDKTNSIMTPPAAGAASTKAAASPKPSDNSAATAVPPASKQPEPAPLQSQADER